MSVNSNVLAVFKAWAEIAGGSYQTLLNEAVKQFAHGVAPLPQLKIQGSSKSFS